MRGLSCTYPALDRGEQQLLQAPLQLCLLCFCSQQSCGSMQVKTALGLEPDHPLQGWMFGERICSHPCDFAASWMQEQHCWAASDPLQVGKDEEPGRAQ